MLRHLTHHPIDPHLLAIEPLLGSRGETSEHVLDVGGRRVHTMALPYDHGSRACLAIRYPAHVVLVVPVGETSRFTQLAAIHQRSWVTLMIHAGAHRDGRVPVGYMARQVIQTLSSQA